MLREAFLKASEKAKGMSINAFIDAIKAERDDLAEKTAYKPTQGGCAFVVFFDDEVFKTARPDIKDWAGFDNGELIREIERERRVLGHLQDKGLPVPELTYTGKDLLFFGMTRLPGEVISKALWNMNEGARKELAHDLAAFCVNLSRQVSVEDAKRLGADKPPGVYAFEPERFRAELADPDVRAVLGAHYDLFRTLVEGYIRHHQEKYPDGETTFMNCDLNGGNILIDPATKKLCGILDFGASYLTCPETALSKFCEFPEGLVRPFLAEYSRLQTVGITLEEVHLRDAVAAVDQIYHMVKEAEGPEKKKETILMLASSIPVLIKRYKLTPELAPAKRAPVSRSLKNNSRIPNHAMPAA